jgi:hypothetical protein
MEADPRQIDTEACAEWLSDRVDLLGPIAQAAVDAYDAHRLSLEDASKN